jgi:uncharacterized protein YqjF (DUF2071 family)
MPPPADSPNSSAPVFLTAEWRHLAMLNYEVAPDIIAPFVPAGTELDFWNGKTFVSVVGFLFLKTKVLGISIPFHRNFEEVNLRFYVRHQAPDGWRRGVVFIREIVPRTAIAWVAKTFYNENYLALPMTHQIESEGRTVRQATYSWKFSGAMQSLTLATRGEPEPPAIGSQAEFITEHYWGYSRQRDGGTMEYQVEHPPWRVQETAAAKLTGDFVKIYGENFAAVLGGTPTSAFLAEGSPVIVRKGVRLP